MGDPESGLSSDTRHEVLAAIFAARVAERIYRHLRKVMTMDDDINAIIDKIMDMDPSGYNVKPLGMYDAIPMDEVHPHSDTSTAAGKPLLLSSASSLPGTKTDSFVNTAEGHLDCRNPGGSPNNYPSIGSAPVENSTPDITGSPSASTHLAGAKHWTLLDEIRRCYEARKKLEVDRYIHYTRNRLDITNGRIPKDLFLNADLKLATFVATAENHVKARLANPE